MLIAIATLVALSTVWLSPGPRLVGKMGFSAGILAAGILLASLAPQARLYADVTENRRNSFAPADEAALVKGLAARASTSQEPWVSFYEPAEMERVLDAGFGDIVHFGTEEALERYLRSRTDGLRLPAYFQMIKARTICGGHYRYTDGVANG